MSARCQMTTSARDLDLTRVGFDSLDEQALAAGHLLVSSVEDDDEPRRLVEQTLTRPLDAVTSCCGLGCAR
jgi:hypothetical protein